MTDSGTIEIIEAYKAYIGNKEFPCIGAKAALASQHIKCLVADHMACAKDDQSILNFLYHFVDAYRNASSDFHSAAVIFKKPVILSEDAFDEFLWQRLQSLAILDSANYQYDPRVDADPASAKFSFSIKEEAFFIIGLHPGSSRVSRQFQFPAIVFNPHAEFEKLRAAHRYELMKEVVRKRDTIYSGSVNPMLKDFGEASEVHQYSGKNYKADWQCPLIITHATAKDNPSA